MMRLLLSPPRLGALLLLLGLAACGGDHKNEAYIEKPVDDLYNSAMDQLRRITTSKGLLLYFRWPYHAMVINIFEMISKPTVFIVSSNCPRRFNFRHW